MKPRKSCNSRVWAALALAALTRAGVCQSVTVTGQVTENLHGKPVPKVTITLRRRGTTGTPPLSDVYTTATSADGRFRIANMLDGPYTVTLLAQGYVLPSLPDGTPDTLPTFTVKLGEQHTLALQMTPTGVISGRIVDLEGDPVRGVQVQAMQYTARNQRTLQARVSTTSNDRGEYRLYGLAPSAYYVQATANNINSAGSYSSVEETIRGPRPPGGFVSTFYPSIRDESASAPVRVAPGEELANIDIRMQPEVLYTVRIKLPSTPASETYAQFMLFDRGTNRNMRTSDSFDTTAEFRSILPGSYSLIGTVQDADGSGVPHSYAHQTLEVRDHDIEMDAPPFTPLFDLTGAVHLDTGAPFSFQEIGIDAQHDTGIYTVTNPRAVIAADGTFVIHNVVQEEYTL